MRRAREGKRSASGRLHNSEFGFGWLLFLHFTVKRDAFQEATMQVAFALKRNSNNRPSLFLDGRRERSAEHPDDVDAPVAH